MNVLLTQEQVKKIRKDCKGDFPNMLREEAVYKFQEVTLSSWSRNFKKEYEFLLRSNFAIVYRGKHGVTMVHNSVLDDYIDRTKMNKKVLSFKKEKLKNLLNFEN